MNNGRRNKALGIITIILALPSIFISSPTLADSWDYSSPVWWEREVIEIERYQDIENPNWSEYYWDDYFQIQWWNFISQYSPPGGDWIDFSHNSRKRWGEPNPNTGEPESWRPWEYRDLGGWYFNISEWNSTWRYQKLQSQWWYGGEGHVYSEARFGYKIPPTLLGRIPKIFIVNVSDAYDDDIDYYSLNGVRPNRDLGSKLINGNGKLVFDLGGILSPGQESGTVELTIEGPFKRSVGEPFTDQNGNSQWDPGEPFTDYNGNNQCEPGRIQHGEMFSWDRKFRYIGVPAGFSAPHLPQVDLSIDDVKVIQVIQDVPLIKDKETLVRVFVSLGGDLEKLDDVKVDAESSW